jgi:GT2 family glycosyltransferase
MDDAERRAPDEEVPPAEQVDELRRLVEVQRDLARAAAAGERAARAEVRSLHAELRDARAQLAAARRELASFRARRSVRAGAAVGDAARRLQRVLRPKRSPPAAPAATRVAASPATPAAATAAPPPPPAMSPPPPDEAALLARLAAAAELPARTEGPLVSIVMLTRDGADHLRRTLPALARGAYAGVELIVVDNASDDDTPAVLAAYAPGFPVTVVRNERNESYAAANNAAARVARGDLLLFLNNDVEPLGPHWLGHLVETLEEMHDVAAVGARLVFPAGRPGPRAGRRFADLTLQHAGIWFEPRDGAPLGVPIGAGGAADGPDALAVREAPALTAACLLVRRTAFEAVGGFDEGYEYGLEDVDLALRLRAAGWRLVYDGRAVLWHHESATRVLDDAEARRRRATANRDRFRGTWAPRLFRTTLADAVAGGGFWRAPLRIRLVPSPGAPGGAAAAAGALRAAGWEVGVAGAGVPDADGATAGDGAAAGDGAFPDVLLVAGPGHDVRVDPAGAVRVGIVGPGDVDAWLAAPWLPDLDLVVAADDASAGRIGAVTGLAATVAPDPLDPVALRAALDAWVAARRITIRSPVPSWEVAPSWGDHHFARDLQRALRRRGRPARIQLRPEWAEPWSARDDVAINLIGVALPPTHPGQVNVLWHISHPDLATPELYERHDVVFVASDVFARWMAPRVTVPVIPLHQATDPERFAPGREGPAHELLFVANSRGVRRHLLDDLLPTDRRLAVYGRGWTPERLDPALLAGELIPNEQLAGYYGAAGIVLNDHWADMQREGFLSNRLYDAAAAGAFVVSDAIDGLAGEFDGGVVPYHGRAELHALVERYLGDAEARRERAARARAAVLARHTFDHRAREILAVVGPLEVARPTTVAPPREGRPAVALP